MYRVVKVLNHNAVLGLNSEDNKEYLLMGKGVGFEKTIGCTLKDAEIGYLAMHICRVTSGELDGEA